MNTPSPPPSPSGSSGNQDKGSLLIGFFLGWAAMIGGGVVGSVLIYVLSMTMPAYGGVFTLLSSLSGLLVPGILVALIVWFAKQGKSRTALGVVAAFVSVIALGILLIAACFGLMAGTNWH